jgi:ABC-type Mn2+/Zn2+ transport system permease subunit
MPDWDTIYYLRYFLMSGPLIGAMCSLLSVFVVLRRMALISEGVSHAGFGGIAVAILLGYYFAALDSFFWQTLTIGAFCLATAALIGWVSRRRRVSEDSAIGIFLTATVALGMMLIQYRTMLPPVFGPDGMPRSLPPPGLEALLFGQFSQVVAEDVAVLAAGAAVIFGIIFALYHQFVYTTLDEEMARINGVNTRLINALLLFMISLVICVCVRMVGFLMITALMIIPGATANMISRRFAGVLWAALVIGTVGTCAATWAALVSPFNRYPPGPLVVLPLFGGFAVVWAFRHFVKPKALPPDAGAPAEAEGRPPGELLAKRALPFKGRETRTLRH